MERSPGTLVTKGASLVPLVPVGDIEAELLLSDDISQNSILTDELGTLC